MPAALRWGFLRSPLPGSPGVNATRRASWPAAAASPLLPTREGPWKTTSFPRVVHVTTFSGGPVVLGGGVVVLGGSPVVLGGGVLSQAWRWSMPSACSFLLCCSPAA